MTAIDWFKEFSEANDAYIEVVAERDSACRERDEAMAKLEEARNDPYYFGHALLKYCDVEDLPFLVRVAMGRAVKDVLAQWRAAGEPSDIPTLKALFPHTPARAES